MSRLDEIKGRAKGVGGLPEHGVTEWRAEVKKNSRYRIVAYDVTTTGDTDPPFVVADDVPLLLVPILLNAPADLAELLGEVERLTGELGEASATVGQMMQRLGYGR